MALNAAAHHRAAEVAAGEKNSGLRAQTAFSAGRPGVLTEPEPEEGAVMVVYVAAPVPLLALPLLARSAGEAVDARTLSFLLARSLAEKKEEEEQRKAEFGQVEELRQASFARAREFCGSKRKRKKRRKKKTPRTCSSYGRAHRGQRQWYVHGWLRWFSAFAVFPSFVGRPHGR